MISTFICAAWSSAALVQSMHASLRSMGIECRSGWADGVHIDSDGVAMPEALDSFSLEDLREFWLNNRLGIEAADVVVVLADTPTREGHAEAEFARMLGKQILWVGRPTLSAVVEGYPRVATPLEAIDVLRDMATKEKRDAAE